MTSMRPAIVICVPHAPPLWMTREDDSSPISLDGTNVRYCGDTPRHQAGHARTQTCSNARSRKENNKGVSDPVHAGRGDESSAHPRARFLRTAAPRPRRDSPRQTERRGLWPPARRGRGRKRTSGRGQTRRSPRPLRKLGVLHASGDQRNGHEIVGHRVRNDSAIDDRHAFGDLAQHEPQRNAQSGGNGLEQFGGCFLLPALNFGEIAQGHLCFGGDFAQGSTLALADATQDIAQFAAQQRSFAQCLSISLL